MFKAVIFDLDGTLLNTLDDLADSINEMLSNHKYPIHSVNSYKYFIGDGAEMLIERTLPSDMRSKEHVKKLTKEFKEIYQQRMFLKTRPYKSIVELLIELKKRSIPMSVLSNKPHQETVKIVNKIFKNIKFEMVKGAVNNIPRKPDPIQALLISKQLNISPDSFLYIGDTDIDMKTAVNAGMFGVGVLWGFREKNELEENGAKAIVEYPEELLKFFITKS